MTNPEGGGSIPGEFQAPKDSADSGQQEVNKPDGQPEQGKQEFATNVAQGEKDLDRLRAVDREKWGRRKKALEVLKPSGDILEDAKAFFQATDINPDRIGSPYSQAYTNGDRGTMLQYFKALDRFSGQPPSGDSNEWTIEYFKTSDNVVKKIVAAAEAGNLRMSE